MTIYCFSSTGNSLHAARTIAQAFDGTVKPITHEATTTDDDMVGLIFPAFFWGAPTIVAEFAKNLRITNAAAYVFSIVVSGGSAHGAENALCLKPAYAAELKTVNNYLPMYEVNDEDDVHANAQTQLQQIIADLKAKKTQRGKPYTPVNRVVRRMMPGPASDAKFTVTGCNACGLCAKVCPVGNISATAGGPAFAHRCEHCLACMHACPAAAIDYGKSAGKTRYIHPEIKLAGLLKFREEQ